MYDDITTFLGPPPLLKNECEYKFKQFYVKLCCDLEPQDFFSYMQVYHVVVGTWSASRYDRYANLLLMKQEQEKRVAAATKKKELAHEENIFDFVKPELGLRTEEEIRESEAMLEPTYQAEINAVPTDIDYAVLCSDSKCIDKMHRMSSAELKKVGDALRQFDRHHATLANKLRRISDNILDGKLKMIETSPEFTEHVASSEPQEVD